jgi:hypothetical protein
VSNGALSNSRNGPASQEVEEDNVDPALVREELNRILSSHYFQTSRRSKEFLQYVVNQKISGNGDLLKERLIGMGLFKRKPDYAAGEDPVVRVRAGDVRRRLELYYAENDVESDILIQIPLGSYAPVFRLRRDDHAHNGSARLITRPVPAGAEALQEPFAVLRDDLKPGSDSSNLGHEAARSTRAEVLTDTSAKASNPESKLHEMAIQPQAEAKFARKSESSRRAISKRVVISILACLALVASLVTAYVLKQPEAVQKRFWSPASVSSKPVLLWLPKPILYRPSDKLFDRYRSSHPDALVTREAREDQFLPLERTDTIQWGDMMPDYDSGPGIGGVVAAINISNLLSEQGIRFELRFGQEASYAEMRSSPVVIIGAINTDWTTQLTSESKFVFDETPGAPNIHELEGSKRVWKMEASNGHVTRDYGLITRQLSGRTGQFLVQVAGITHFGTEAASEFLANKKEFATALRSASISLQNTNLQIVLSTDVTDGTTGPPRVVAVSSW